MKSEKASIGDVFVVIVTFLTIIIGIGSVIFLNIQSYTNEQAIEITVKDKYIKNGSGKNSSSKYLVVDTENNTYQITDLLFKGKFNSTDLYNQLEVNKRYKIETIGNRMHYFSMYPNINKIEEIIEAEWYIWLEIKY